MDHNGLVPSGPSDRQITMDMVNREAWITGLVDYVNSMRTYCPDVTHPPEDWLSQGFSMLSSDHRQLAAALSTHQGDSAMAQSLKEMRRTLDKHTRRNTASELRARQVHLSQQEKDRRFRVSVFLNKIAQYHTGDLFDIETCVMDLAEHAKHLIQNLAPLIGQPVSNLAELELRIDSSKVYTEEQLAPLIGMVWFGKL